MPIPFVPHSPRFVSCSYEGDVFPFIWISVDFDVTMDTTSIPDPSHWDAVLNGVPTAIDDFHWETPTQLWAKITFIAPPPATAILRLNTVDISCLDVNGNIAIAPQQCQALP